jgi:hypothetical protein
MTGVTPAPVNVLITAVATNVAMPTGGANDVVTLNIALDDKANVYSGGTLTIPGFPASFPIYLNSDNAGFADTINVPANSFTVAQAAALNAGATVAAQIVDDDVIPATGTMPLPSGGTTIATAFGTTGNVISSAFGTAYVLPLYVDSGVAGNWNTVGTVPMVDQGNDYRHLSDNLAAIGYDSGPLKNRDLTSTAAFWTTLVVGAFENKPDTDGDPGFDAVFGPGAPASKVIGSDSEIDFGVSGKTGSDQNISAIFLESIRDIGFPSDAEVVTHEVGHTAGSGLSHTKTGLLMKSGYAGRKQFDNYCLWFMRGLDVW